MSEYETILVPTDGSDGAGAALEAARDLAETHEATVHVLYVVDTSHPALGIGGDPNTESSPGMVGDPQGADTPMSGERELSREIRQEAREYGKEAIDDATDRLRDVDTEAAVDSGEPVETILQYADEHDADLVVMGTHGRTGLERYLIGSVAEKMLRMADVPVLAVPDGSAG
ncbi:Nucleotide-binding universal stress protein, UspA family [Halobiforma haloterrestris]|uniref:Nucleotide-binding universal stress protein, UspA family n=1 Tax=Natronobacterium haloterrestre TaxID=148448 RepID=A0A1I1K2T2_NATHA|nr:universal stress protein [Halobiforma haloterrestris]SFC54532.1 Nucleotide-binding universal stress protein, UspA family [Halobiforma haloterrestris]